jgi:hypothetical protein
MGHQSAGMTGLRSDKGAHMIKYMGTKSTSDGGVLYVF